MTEKMWPNVHHAWKILKSDWENSKTIEEADELATQMLSDLLWRAWEEGGAYWRKEAERTTASVRRRNQKIDELEAELSASIRQRNMAAIKDEMQESLNRMAPPPDKFVMHPGPEPEEKVKAKFEVTIMQPSLCAFIRPVDDVMTADGVRPDREGLEKAIEDALGHLRNGGKTVRYTTH